jgi:hypothetical protein
MKITALRVQDTAFLHLKDANEELLYEDEKRTQPVGLTLYGPGSKVYAKANQAKQNKLMDRLKKKGRTDMTPEESAEENATFLAACTAELHYLEPEDGSTGAAAAKAIYLDQQAGHIAEQAGKFLTDWGNFSKASATT